MGVSAILARRDLSEEVPVLLHMLGCRAVVEEGSCRLDAVLSEGFVGAAVARVAGWTVIFDAQLPVREEDVDARLAGRVARTLASRSSGGEVLHLLCDPLHDRYGLCVYRNARQVRGVLWDGDQAIGEHGEPVEDTTIPALDRRFRGVLTDRVAWTVLEAATFRVFRYRVPAQADRSTAAAPAGETEAAFIPQPPVDPGEAGWGSEDPADWEAEDGYDPGVQVDQALRWRLVLGQFSDEHLALERFAGEGSGGLLGADLDLSRVEEAMRMDRALEYIYDREYARRAHRQAGGGGGGLSIPAWLTGVRTLFPEEAVRVIENDALSRYGLTELVTDPEILRTAEPTEALMKAILQFKHRMEGEVLEAAREVVKEVVAELSESLKTECRPALFGPVDPDGRPPPRTFRNTDWNKTIHRNLKNFDTGRGRLIADRISYKHRQQSTSRWRIILAVDQSGSMMDSLIHSAIMAAIFASLPTVSCHLVLWDHRIMDVSEMVHDPVEVLMSCQLGGGTAMHPAMQYCAQLITEPERTIFVLISDWYIWSEKPACLSLAHALTEAGVTGIGLCALDADARPIYDEAFARELAGQGWFVAALTPKKLAEHVGRIIA